jgi:uncharacterized protein DUF4157
MSEYAEARRNPGRPAAEVTHRSPQHAQAETPFAPRGPGPGQQDALTESLNQSARVQSLLQAKQMLHDSPRMASQRALQRALNPDVDRVAIQREVLPDEEEVAQAQYGPVQRQAASAAGQPEEEDDILQGRFEPAQPVPDSEPAQPSQPNRTGLPDNLKTAVETLSGFSLSDVRVHYNSPQPAQLHALAYAQGSDIHVGPGQERHLPHEAWHVVQQKQGRVKPTLQMKGVPINDDAGLEREADAMGNWRGVSRHERSTSDWRPRSSISTKSFTQLMKIRGTDEKSYIASETKSKHVVATGGQQAKADELFGDSTFVTTEAELTQPVDADAHDFTEAKSTPSARHAMTANVVIDQWNKTIRNSGGLARKQPAGQVLNATSTACEIGVTKTGDDRLKIDHFKKS